MAKPKKPKDYPNVFFSYSRPFVEPIFAETHRVLAWVRQSAFSTLTNLFSPRSLFEAFYWAIITMTTVGVGDVVPATDLGKLTGQVCAVVGILSIAFPVPIVVSNFNYLYTQDKEDYKLVPGDLVSTRTKCKIYSTEVNMESISESRK